VLARRYQGDGRRASVQPPGSRVPLRKQGKLVRIGVRVRSEAAFARLAGAAPIPASSGQTNRHRLSRGGDRQLNRALHTVILHRRLHDPATKDYIARRVAEGKSRRDAVRLLKRYLARHLYRLLEQQKPLMT
jgi:transposase